MYARMVFLPPGTPMGVASRLRRKEASDYEWFVGMCLFLAAALTAGLAFDTPIQFWLFALAAATVVGMLTVAYRDRARARAEELQYGQRFVIECEVFAGDFSGPDRDLAAHALLAFLELDSLPEGSPAHDELWATLYGRIAALPDSEQKISPQKPVLMRGKRLDY